EDVERGIAQISCGIAEAIKLSHRRLGEILEAVIEMSLGVGCEASYIQVAVQVLALGERLGETELTHQPAVFIKNIYQRRLPHGCDRHFAFGKRPHRPWRSHADRSQPFAA